MEIAKRVRLVLLWQFFVGLSVLWPTYVMSHDGVTTVPFVLTEQPAFSEATSSGPEGYAVTLGQRIIEEAGLRADPRLVPRARQEALLQKGELMMASALVREPSRESLYYWIAPLTSSRWEFFVKRSHPLATKPNATLADIQSASTVRGESRERVLVDASVPALLKTGNWVQAVEAVLQDRVEGILFSRAGLSVVCETAKFDCDELVSIIDVGERKSYFVVPKKPQYRELAASLQAAGERVIQSKQYNDLANTLIKRLAATGVSAFVSDGVVFYSDIATTLAKTLWVMAEEAPMFSERNRTGGVSGFAAEYVTAILNEAGIAKEILISPWERIEKERRKANVLAVSVARTPERENEYYWIAPIVRNLHALYGIGETRYSSFDEVPKDKRIAVLDNDYRQDVAKSEGFQVAVFENYRDAVNALLTGDVDYVFSSLGGITNGCKQIMSHCSHIRMVAEYKRVTLYIALSKQHADPTLAAILQQATQRVTESEAFKRWLDKWGETFRRDGRVQHHFDDGVINLWHEEQ